MLSNTKMLLSRTAVIYKSNTFDPKSNDEYRDFCFRKWD